MKCLLLTAMSALLAVSIGFADQSKEKVIIPVNKTAASDGKQMFTSYCAPCHGVDAKGHGPVAAALKKQPDDLTGLMKKNAKDPEVAGLNGIVLLNSGKASDAVNALQDAAKNSPKDAFLQYWLGSAALAKGDIDLAEKSLRQAATLNPSRLDAQEELARIAAQRGDTDLLSDVADKTIAAAPRFPGGYVWRAMVEMRRNSADKAEADLKTAMNVAPQSSQAYLQLGKIRFSQKRFPEGVSLLEQALQYNPNSYLQFPLLKIHDSF